MRCDPIRPDTSKVLQIAAHISEFQMYPLFLVTESEDNPDLVTLPSSPSTTQDDTKKLPTAWSTFNPDAPATKTTDRLFPVSNGGTITSEGTSRC